MPQRDGIIERLQPLIGQLADGLVALASDLAREHVIAALETMPLTDPKPVRRKAKRSGARLKAKPTKRPAKAAKAKSGSGAKRQNHCRNCGAAGYQTKTCGRTHNVASPAGSKRIVLTPEQLEEVDDEMEEAPAAKQVGRRDRFHLLEEAARRRRGAA